MREWECRWLLHGKELPEGWEFADMRPAHHDFYSRLIKRQVPEGQEEINVRFQPYGDG